MASSSSSSPSSSSSSLPSSLLNFSTLRLSMVSEGVLHVALHRKPVNAMNRAFWKEMVDCFTVIGSLSFVRVVLISGGDSNIFSAGLDLKDHLDLFASGGGEGDVGRKAFKLREFILAYQKSFNVIEAIPQPVIAVVGGACIGGGLDLICAADIRIASNDASFVLKEVDIGMVADVGVIQRARKIINNPSVLADMALTARAVKASEALSIGLISAVFDTREQLWNHAVKLAKSIAEKSPVAVRAIKETLIHARDNSVPEGLRYVANMNAALLQSSDLVDAVQAGIAKTKPVFANL